MIRVCPTYFKFNVYVVQFFNPLAVCKVYIRGKVLPFLCHNAYVDILGIYKCDLITQKGFLRSLNPNMIRFAKLGDILTG